MDCPHCHSSSTTEREGRTVQGFRRFRCRGCGRRFNERTGTALNRVQVPTDIMFLVVFWRLRYKLSLRDLAEMFLIRGIVFTHEAVRDWEAKLAPLLAEGLRKRRDMAAAKAFLRSARSVTQVEPEQVTTDGHTSYPKAIAEELGTDVDHRTSQYKNNVMEQDHRGIKGRYRSMRGFKNFDAAHRFCRAFDELPAPDQLHQPERFARPSAGHPRAARGCAAGLDLRRLIQLLVSSVRLVRNLPPK